MTPDKLIKSLDSLKEGEIGFCVIASVAAQNDDTIHNIGFWFEIIENKLQLVLSVNMDSFTVNKPAPSIIITNIEQLYEYIKNVRQWAEYELMAFFSLSKSHYCSAILEYYDHSLSA